MWVNIQDIGSKMTDARLKIQDDTTGKKSGATVENFACVWGQASDLTLGGP